MESCNEFLKLLHVMRVFCVEPHDVCNTELSIVSEEGVTALHFFAEWYRPTMDNKSASQAWARVLSIHDVDASDALGRTPMHIASQRGCPRAVAELIAAGADVNRSVASTRFSERLNERCRGWTPLMYAIAGRDAEEVEQSAPAGIFSCSIDPSSGAACVGHFVFDSPVAADDALTRVSLLLKAGANPNASAFGLTPLELAQSLRDSEVGELLLLAGADPSRMSHHDWTWLQPLISKLAHRYLEDGVPKKKRRTPAARL